MLKFLTALLILIVVAAPLPLGSNRDWVWHPLALTVGLATLLQGIRYLTVASTGRRDLSTNLMLPGLGMVGICVWASLQCLPMDFLPPLDSPFTGANAALGLAPPHRIAIDVEAAITGIELLLTYGACFWVASTVCNDARSATWLCVAFVATAVGVTLFGLATYAPNTPLSGTFVNPDNYATYVGLACLVSLLTIQQRFLSVVDRRQDERPSWRTRLAPLSGRNFMWIAALVVLVAGMFTSSSRGGLAALVVASLLGTTLFSILQRRGLSAIIWMVAILLVGGAAIFLLAGERMAYRLVWLMSNPDEDRTALYAMTRDAIAAHPFAGWGLGAFKSLFSVYQPASMSPIYDKVHDTYLETALDIGIPGALALFAIIALIAARCLAGMRARSRDAHFPAIGLVATLFIGLHAIFDFGVQIPAIALSYAVLLGMAWAQSWSSRKT